MLALRNLPASRCLSALAKLRWASGCLAGFALLLCAGFASALRCAGLDWAAVDVTTHVPLPGITMRATLKPPKCRAGLRWVGAGLGWAALTPRQEANLV